jgi:hypothetical protein
VVRQHPGPALDQRDLAPQLLERLCQLEAHRPGDRRQQRLTAARQDHRLAGFELLVADADPALSGEPSAAAYQRDPWLSTQGMRTASIGHAQDAVTLRSSALGMRRRVSQSRTRKHQTPLL